MAKFAQTAPDGSVKLMSPKSMIVSQPVTLSKEQNKVLQMVKQGVSIFFTGSAGTGKSFLLRRIIGKILESDRMYLLIGRISILEIRISLKSYEI